MRYTIEELKDGDYKISFEEKRLFRKTKLREFVGSCTVWHELPNFKRAPTHLESWLSECWEKARFEKKYIYKLNQ